MAEGGGSGRRIFVTGGSGFIGRAVVRGLLARGDTVTSLVRDRRRGPTETLEEPAGLTVIRGDTTGPVERLAELMAGHDGVIHLAGSYRVGIPPSERPAMFAANVTAATRILDAAVAANVPRIVDISTVNAFGDTHGVVVDETYRRDPAGGFLSWYDETKYRAHEVARDRIGAGAPVIVAMPSQTYGPGDHSGVGEQLTGAFAGSLRYRAVDDVGLAFVHVDDLADGILRVLDRGRLGELYVLGGPCVRLGEAIGIAARLGGRRPPRLRMPDSALRLMIPLAPRLGGRFGMPLNLAEVMSASGDVTYWATSEKARGELGFAPRDLETGLRDWLVGDGTGGRG